MGMSKSALLDIAQQPATFAIAVGVVNGVLAVARNKPVTPNAAYITAAVIAVGEVALVAELPPDKRPDLWRFGTVSFLGTLAGIAPFAEWGGKRSAIQQIAEAMTPMPSAAA